MLPQLEDDSDIFEPAAYMTSLWFIISFALSIEGFVSTANDEARPIDTQGSLLIIHVGEAGLFFGRCTGALG